MHSYKLVVYMLRYYYMHVVTLYGNSKADDLCCEYTSACKHCSTELIYITELLLEGRKRHVGVALGNALLFFAQLKIIGG